MHEGIDHDVSDWLRAATQENLDSHYGKFICLWIAFNQLYNFHCYDMHPDCRLDNQLAADLKPRSVASTAEHQPATCGRSRNDEKCGVREWGSVVCVVRFLSRTVQEQLLDSEDAEYFANRQAYSPILRGWTEPNCGVLDIHRTQIRSPQEPLYTIGFVDAWNNYRSRHVDSSVAIQHLARLLYTVRCNLVHGGKTYRSENNAEVISRAIPLLELIVKSLIEMNCEDFCVLGGEAPDPFAE
jgi:hypothetical protein